ncbi:MAG TPA: Asp-tRNA(Asn)/Glu-tRNA(Gln) amidotransferase subunit GatC [Burkholderiaceae bacterium]|jgi:aspartyl-tRNA(Asn)/glutamyl-tRNA(Gln) amidotransferase subunit C|nr:Asp-tRNA(Asn)/Glu-tRNA(Gln) amidotransferase subunit GatC [Burkholderiaceae bacterium]
MSLTLADVHRIAHLARIDITEEQARAAVAQLNDIFAMIEQIGRVDATGVAPMTHPLDGAQRLREDAVDETPPDRDELLRNAPAQQDGLFLVPRVIE